MQFLGSRHFKTLHLPRGRALRRDLAGCGVRKDAIDRVELIDERTLRFTASTGCVDRDLDCIAVAGWQLDAFARNPVVLWAHRADEPPIGKAIDFGRDDSRLYAAVQFLPVEGYGRVGEFADTIYRLAANGYLSATSVGFRPLKWDFTDDVERGGEDWMPGIDFHEQELVELSLVPVPSNPEALIEPGGAGDRDTAPALIPAPAQVLAHLEARDRRRRRARAAVLGVL
jgi:HK97 family phage prohead protease